MTRLAINANQQQAFEVTLPVDTKRYTRTAKQPQDKNSQLNGKTLQLDSNGELRQPTGESACVGRVSFALALVTFLGIAKIDSPICH